MKQKGVSPLVSFVLYTAIAVLVISIVLTVGFPYIEKMRDSISIKQAQDFLGVLDNTITEVALAGENSRVPVTLRFERGRYIFSSDKNALTFSIETESNVVSQGASRQVGALILYADANGTHVFLGYNESDLVLNGFNKTLFPGTYNLIVENSGVVNNNLVIEVES